MNLNRLKTYWAGCLVAIVIGLVGVSSAAAANLIWTNTTPSGIYSDSGNWNPVLVPGAQAIDATIFTNGTDYTVNFTANATVATNYFNSRAGAVTLDITGFTWNLTNNANGSSASALSAFVIAQGLNTTATVYLAGGTLAVTNSATTPAANLLIGGQGVGTFFVTNGTVIANQTKIGTTATGLGKLVLSGSGVYYTNTSTFNIGSSASSTGNSLVISNSASLTTIGLFSVGGSSSGNSLLITNGSLTAVQATIGNGSANNSATLLAGGYWSSSSTFIIGTSGGSNNSVTINGGVMTNSGANVGSVSTGSGGYNSLIITNGGLCKSTAGFTVANGVGGTSNSVSVLDNGIFDLTSQKLNIGISSYATGNYVRVDGGTVTNVGQNTAGQFGNGLYIGGGTSGSGTNAFGNGLLIANTGKVFMSAASSFNPIYIGFQSGANGNYVTVTNGGQLYGGSIFVGSTNSYNNQYNVGGGVNKVTVYNTNITVGYFSGGNAMTVTNADLQSGTAIIGSGGSNNTATVLADSIWKLRAATLTIGNGAATGNVLRVFGGIVTNVTTLTVSANNLLTLRDGGAVFATTTTVAGVLSGTGKLGGKVTIAAGGTLSPGFSTGTLTFNNDLTLTGTADMELSSGGNLGGADKVIVFGTLSGGGLVRVTTNGTFTIAAGDKWDLFDWSIGTPTLTFDGSAIALPGGLEWDITQLNIDGTITVIPEPATLVLVAGGLVFLALQRQRRRANRPRI